MTIDRLVAAFRVAAFILPFAGAAAPAVAADVLTSHRMSAALAGEAVTAAVAACAAQGYHESATVVDAEGIQQAALRGDDAPVQTIENSFDKAYTAANFKTDTGALVERAKTQSVSPALARLPHLILSQGAVVIKIGDEVIGAIGASGAPGGEKDEACARAGLARIGGRLE